MGFLANNKKNKNSSRIQVFVERLKEEKDSSERRYLLEMFAEEVESGRITLDGIKRTEDVLADIDEYFKDTTPEVSETIRTVRLKKFLEKFDSELLDREPDLDKIEADFFEYYNIYRKDKSRNLDIAPYSEKEKYQMLSRILENYYSDPVYEFMLKEQQRNLFYSYQNRAIEQIKSTQDISEKQRIYGTFIKDFVEDLDDDEKQMVYIDHYFEGEPFVKSYDNAKKCEKYGIEYIGEPIAIYEATEEAKKKTDKKNIERATRRKNKEANISDLIMVRTTSTIPRFGVVETTGKHTMPILDDSLFIDEIKELGLDPSEYEMYSFMSRSTSHWTLNGLVQSHAYGDFSSRDYIIIEPFEEHVDEDGLLNVAETDTYFEQDLKLSDRATILMPLERYKEIIKDKDKKTELQRYKIALFTGNEEIATQMLLEEQGYVYGNLGLRVFSHNGGALGDELDKLQDVMKRTAEERQVGYQLRHFNSSIRYEDLERVKELKREKICKFVDFLAENSDVNFSPEHLKGLFINGKSYIPRGRR